MWPGFVFLAHSLAVAGAFVLEPDLDTVFGGPEAPGHLFTLVDVRVGVGGKNLLQLNDRLLVEVGSLTTLAKWWV